jgi:uncharacterized UBP type Zn finger protein
MACHHFDDLPDVPDIEESYEKGCAECIKMGDEWVHLRECLICGNVGCCDSSMNKHATKHFHATKHPVMRSLEPGDGWEFCYVDEEIREF